MSSLCSLLLLFVYCWISLSGVAAGGKGKARSKGKGGNDGRSDGKRTIVCACANGTAACDTESESCASCWRGFELYLDDSDAMTCAVPEFTSDEIAAGGPVVNHSLSHEEHACASAKVNPPWTSTLLSYEHSDSARSKMYPCATFTGSRTSPNRVYAFRASKGTYYAPSMMVTRGENELYIYGGSLGNANPLPPGPYVARVEVGTLKELWRTPLLNTHITGQWIGAGSLESIKNQLLVICNTNLFKLDASTGEVLNSLDLPTIGSAPYDSYFNGLAGWSDGTLVMKNLARVPGCKINGFFALSTCPNLHLTPNSTVVVVDFDTLKVRDYAPLPEMIGGRITATEWKGKKYAYVAGKIYLYRYVWDGVKITMDSTWGPIPYLLPGQGQASACSIMGEWVVLQTNGVPSPAPLSIVAVSQNDPSRINRIQPMPLAPGVISNIPSASSVDLPNGRIYAMDAGPGMVCGIDLNQTTGQMSLAWRVQYHYTLSWMVLIGPADARVLVATNISAPAEPNSVFWASGPKGANYMEQLMWRDAASGRLLAASSFYTPMVVGMQPWPGYGGLMYDALTDGGLVAMQVLPAP